MPELDVKFGNKTYCVLTKVTYGFGTVETFVFGDEEAAKIYCQARYGIPLDQWIGQYNPKYNLDESETLYIHTTRMIVEF